MYGTAQCCQRAGRPVAAIAFDQVFLFNAVVGGGNWNRKVICLVGITVQINLNRLTAQI